MQCIIGTAGWTIPTSAAAAFPEAGSALERYAARFKGVEINSSFHRSHRSSTWSRWAASVPDDFSFSVKLPKEISHTRKLVDCQAPLEAVLNETSALGDKLSVLLLQLPPKLMFEPAVAGPFLTLLTTSAPAQIACEPRHSSWFGSEADAMLRDLRIARVAADPTPAGCATEPGGWSGFRYWRLHGSPHIYRSSYHEEYLKLLAASIRSAAAQGTPCWCIFDNTASSAATGDALRLAALL